MKINQRATCILLFIIVFFYGPIFTALLTCEREREKDQGTLFELLHTSPGLSNMLSEFWVTIPLPNKFLN